MESLSGRQSSLRSAVTEIEFCSKHFELKRFKEHGLTSERVRSDFAVKYRLQNCQQMTKM